MQDARDDRAVATRGLPGWPRFKCGLSDFQASSDNQNKLFAMMIPSSNKLYGFSTYASTLNQGIEQMSSL